MKVYIASCPEVPEAHPKKTDWSGFGMHLGRQTWQLGMSFGGTLLASMNVPIRGEIVLIKYI